MDHYQTLGVSKQADAKEIKNAYRKLAGKHHPDKGGNEEEFKKVQKAYETLSDTNKRAEYDNPSPFGGGFRQGSQPFDMNDIFGAGSPFGDIFGQRGRPQRQPMFRTTLQVSLRQAYTGGQQTLELNTNQGKNVVNVTIPKGVQTGQQIQYPNVIDANTALIIDFHVHEDSFFARHGYNPWRFWRWTSPRSRLAPRQDSSSAELWSGSSSPTPRTSARRPSKPS